MTDRPSGEALAAEIRAWMARTGSTATRFGESAFGSANALRRIERAAFPLRRTVERTRAFLAAHPDGCGGDLTMQRITPGEASGKARKAPSGVVSAAPSRPTGRASQAEDQARRASASVAERERVLARGRAEAAKLERSRAAMRAGPPLRLTPAEQVTTAMLEGPGDLVALLKRQWPELWREVLLSARAAGERPGVHVVECVRRGLGG